MDFANRLRELRMSKGLSQGDLASKLGVSKSRISMYEVGSRQPDFEMLEKIADYFNVDIDYLLGKENVSTYVMTPEQKEVIDAICENAELLDLMRKAMNKNYYRKLRMLLDIMEDDNGNTNNR